MEKQGHWWRNVPTERYWLESTDREDLGADLRAPELDESGRENWRYSLFKLSRPGDVVYHYHKPQDAIIAVSRVQGEWKSRPIVWGARGTFARAKGVRPRERPGYTVPLTDFRMLASPLGLDRLRADKAKLQQLLERLRSKHPGHVLYFPFELADRPVRPLQGYAFKLPSEFVHSFNLEDLVSCRSEPHAESRDRSRSSGQGFVGNIEYRLAVERHAMAVALRYYRRKGFRVKNVSRTHPYDVLASNAGAKFAVEVKGTAGSADAVFLTRNEVEHARRNADRSILFVVHGIKVEQVGSTLAASGGTVHEYAPWFVDEGMLEPLQFRYVLPVLK